MPVFPKVTGVLEQSMKAAGLRHQVIANNIANVNVPGFQASEVSFEEHLKEAIQQEASPETGLQGLVAHERHIPINLSRGPVLPVEPRIQPTVTGQMRQDGNNVDIEAEQAKLAANQLWYQSLVRSLQDEFSRLRTAIMEGRR
ncbi:MAG TPA: flagellar basal body rod protein FlgB [Symbiobacteriaceae bacterium]|nr:flagellar basal body rod protein FlgB [Symbiobacteriaceae bacterium]